MPQRSLVHGYRDYDGTIHLFDTHHHAMEAWSHDDNAGVSQMPYEDSGLSIVDHRVMSPRPTRRVLTPEVGSFAHFQSLGR